MHRSTKTFTYLLTLWDEWIKKGNVRIIGTFDFVHYINGDLIKSFKLSIRLFWQHNYIFSVQFKENYQLVQQD